MVKLLNDRNIFLSDANILFRRMNEESEKIALWFRADNLSSNVKKENTQNLRSLTLLEKDQ